MSIPRVRADAGSLSLAGITLSPNDALRLGHRLIAMALPNCTKATLRSSVANSLVSKLALDLTIDDQVDLNQYLKEREESEPGVAVLCEAKPSSSPTPTRTTAPLQNRDALSLLLRKG